MGTSTAAIHAVLLAAPSSSIRAVSAAEHESSAGSYPGCGSYSRKGSGFHRSEGVSVSDFAAPVLLAKL